MLNRYSEFATYLKINENIAGAKKILKDTYILNKAAKEVDNGLKTDSSGIFLINSKDDRIKFTDLPDNVKEEARKKVREIKLSEEETRRIERSEILKNVREILGDKHGYAQMFTYLAVKEEVPMEELRLILSKLVEYKDLLTQLRRPITNYIDPNIPNNSEQLLDDFENISLHKKTKKLVGRFTPELKKEYDAAPNVTKTQIEQLAFAFDDLGKKNGVVDKAEQEKLFKLFFGEMKMVDGKPYYSGQMRRYKNIREFIKSAENFLKSINNSENLKFYEMIEKCNEKYGAYGAQVMFDEGGILILEIKSFQANVVLNSHTRHCIKDSLYQWNNYIGGDNIFTRQYYIYNFNLPSYDTKSVIGITIEPQQKIRACHLKDDAGYSSEFKNLLKRWEREYNLEDLWQHFPPMTNKEIDEKKRRLIANKELVRKNLSLAQLKKYIVEDGGDMNASNGQALDNAVEENDLAKATWLLEAGASPNLRSKQEASINKIKDFEMLKVMLNHQAELTSQVFKPLVDNYEAVEFCLKNGLDPNFEENMPLRMAIKKKNLKIVKLLEEYNVSADNSRQMNTKTAAENQAWDIVEYFVTKGGAYTQGWDKVMHWMGHTMKQTKEEKLNSLGILQKYIDDGKVTCNDTGYKFGNRRDATHAEVIKEYGNLKNWVIFIHPTVFGGMEIDTPSGKKKVSK